MKQIIENHKKKALEVERKYTHMHRRTKLGMTEEFLPATRQVGRKWRDF